MFRCWGLSVCSVHWGGCQLKLQYLTVSGGRLWLSLEVNGSGSQWCWLSQEVTVAGFYGCQWYFSAVVDVSLLVVDISLGQCQWRLMLVVRGYCYQVVVVTDSSG